MAIDLTGLSFEDLTKLEASIKARKNEMHNNKDAFYKAEAFDKTGIYKICEKRFPIEQYPKAKILHYADRDVVAYSSDLYFRFEKAVLTICDATIGNYLLTADEKIKFSGAVVTKHPKEYLALCNDICDVIKKYDSKIFDNGKDIL